MPASRKSIPYSKNGDKPRFVYGLVDPNSNQIRYVGCSFSPKTRLKAHTSTASGTTPRMLEYWGKHTPVYEWIYGLLKEGKRPSLVILEECTPDNWRERENDWIVRLDSIGTDLTNVRTIAGFDNLKRNVVTRAKGRRRYFKWVSNNPAD